MELLNENGEMFGLEMVDASDGELRKGTIYVMLGRMEENELVESEAEDTGKTATGAAKRMYSATDYGRRVFKAQEIASRYLDMGSW